MSDKCINTHTHTHIYIYCSYIQSLLNICTQYRIAGRFGGKNIWQIALIMAFGGFYFGGWVSQCRLLTLASLLYILSVERMGKPVESSIII